MRKKTGIVRKTFLFAALLIVLVTFVSVAILYFAMPSFYLYKKEQSLKAGLVSLEVSLKESMDQETCMVLIANFAEGYNVTVTSIDLQGMPILTLSSPFVSLPAMEKAGGQLVINGEFAEDEQLTEIIYQFSQTFREDLNQKTSIMYKKEDVEAYLWIDIGNTILLETDIKTDIIDKIQVQGTLQPIEEARGVILSLIPYVLAAGCAIGLCLAWIYARQITKPILKLSEAAVRMKQMEYFPPNKGEGGSPEVIAEIKTGDELELLSDNMNALYQSLSKTIEDLKMEMEKVSRLEQSKTEMMQSASHELKTPIAALGGMLDGMIEQVGVYKDKETYLRKCRGQVEKLSFLVKEILEASRTDRRGQADKPVEIEVDEMIKKILTEYEFQIGEKQLQLKTEMNKVAIRTDPAVLYRVIMNLIGNAVSYTPRKGELRIKLSKEQLVIENQCSYIPEEEMQKLFEPFYTRSSSRDKTVSGTGLGLYIVKRNLEQLAIPYQAESTETGFKISLFFS